MADVRINGRRLPAMQAIDSMGVLISRLETLGQHNEMVLTTVTLNGRQIDLESAEIMRLRVEPDDTVEARMETPRQLSFESLHVATEMAELLVFDIKVATLQLWENSKFQEKSLETLLSDCKLFLTLGARPVLLLGQEPARLPDEVQACLRQLDAIASHLQDTTLLAVSGKTKDACHVLVARVMPAIERWLQLTVAFAECLEIDGVDASALPIDFVGNESKRVVDGRP